MFRALAWTRGANVSLDRHELAMRAYESERGPLNEHARRDLLAAGRARDQLDPRKSRDPLGHDSTPGLDHRTRANRSAVASVLREYYAGTLDHVALNKPVMRSDSQTGTELADKMVSRLEVAAALALLRRHDLAAWLAVTREYRDGLTRAELAERWRKAPATIKREAEAGLDALIVTIFIDVQ